MKTTIGGDRLGSGNKQNVSLKNYNRSTHDLSYLWRSSMSCGTLVPFMNLVALPGDSFDIDLSCEVLTLPTVGPLFGSFKVQLDVFQVPIRLYNAALHMNKLGIGMDMSSVYFPQIKVSARSRSSWNPEEPTNEALKDNAQVNSSALIKYLGISGIGHIDDSIKFQKRKFNGIPYLGYWDIYKNYYANKQEERGVGIHTDTESLLDANEVLAAELYNEEARIGDILGVTRNTGNGTISIIFQFGDRAQEIDGSNLFIDIDGAYLACTTTNFTVAYWREETKQFIIGYTATGGSVPYVAPKPSRPRPKEHWKVLTPSLVEFPLSNIDDMRTDILQANLSIPFNVSGVDYAPYKWVEDDVRLEANIEPESYSVTHSQEGLGIKTYQSDLFNNWISTEWIDGANGINEVTAVDTTGDSFTIDSLNLANKVYNMLNRIAISGGSYDDWLDAVYTHERAKSVESPMYYGSLIKELAFESVVSNSETEVDGNTQPLGTLAGRGRLTSKNKGGKIKINVDEPSYIMGIVSLTPRVDYSQGNMWDVNLQTMNDLHKPALDAIGYQDLITEQMAWQSTNIRSSGEIEYRSAGKQPAWINYMTAVNKTYGNFAEESKEMFMTLNRKYDISLLDGTIRDLTTYIDPVKYNQIFADTNLDAQNFWVQISNDITARRKMSAKVIPNL